MTKPYTKPTARNPRMCRSGRLAVLNHFMDAGSVSTAENLGAARNVPPGVTAPGNCTIADYTTGAPSATTMGTVEGGSLALGTTRQLIVWANSSGVTNKFYEVEHCVRFTSPLNMNTATAATFMQTTSAVVAGRGQWQKTTTPNQLVFRIYNGTTQLNATFTVTDLTSPIELRVVKSALGNKAMVNGVEGTYDAGFTSYSGPLITENGSAWTLNKGTNPGQMTLLKNELWVGCTLDPVERREFEADTYIMLRPGPDRLAKTTATASIPKRTSFDVRLVSNDSYSGTLRARVVWATTRAGLDTGPTVAGTWTTTDLHTGNIISVTGCPSGGTVYWRVEEDAAGDGVWRPLAGGYQRMRLMHDTEPVPLWGREGHFNDATNTPATQITPKWFDDVLLTDDSSMAENSAVLGKQWASFFSGYAVWLRDRGYDFGVDTGDSTEFVDNGWDDGLGTVDWSPSMFTAWKNAENQELYYDKMCGWARVPGNHGMLASCYKLMTGASYTNTDAKGKWALNLWLQTTPNVDNTYFGVGEYGTSGETQPPTAAVPARFVPYTEYAVGDIVRPSVSFGDNLQAYECDGAGMAANEPVWTANPTGGFASGATTWRLVPKRWDTVCIAALEVNGLAVNNYPRRTWFQFDWGNSGVSVFIGDSESYSLINHNNGFDNTTDFNEYGFGATQTLAIYNWARYNTAPVKLFFSHRSNGGEYFGVGSVKGYDRGTGWRIGYGPYYETIGYPEATAEITMDQLFKQAGVIWLCGHDHVFSLARSQAGTLHVRSTTSGASSHTSLTSTAPTRGWVATLAMASKGTPDTRGAYDVAGNNLLALGMIYRLNSIGVQEIETSATQGIRITVVETVLPTQPLSSTGYLSRIRQEIPRLISDEPVTPSGGFVSLTTTLNPNPKPLKIGGVFLSSDVATIVGSGEIDETTATAMANANILLNKYDPTTLSAYHVQWNPSDIVVAGQAIFPTAPTGLMAIATSTGTLGLTEPSPWPTTVGATGTNGTVSYVMRPIGLWPHEWFELGLPTSIPVVSGTTAACKVQWVPRVVYRSNWLTTVATGFGPGGSTVGGVPTGVDSLGVLGLGVGGG